MNQIIVNKSKSELFAYLLLLITMILWGATMPLGRWMVSESLGETIPPLIIVIIRFAIVVFVLFIIVFWKNKNISGQFARENWKPLSILGVLIIGVYQTGFMLGEFYTSASDVSLIISSSPIWLLVIAVTVLKERITIKKVLGAVIGFIGVIAIIGFSPNVNVPDRMLGSAFTLLAAISTAIYTLYLRRFTKKVTDSSGKAPSSLLIITWSSLFGLILIAPITLFFHPQYLTLSSYLIIPARIWVGIGYLVFFATVIGLLAYIEGVKRLSADRAIIFLNLVPVLGVLLSAWFLGEIIDPVVHTLSLSLIIIGVMLVNSKTKPKILSKKAQHNVGRSTLS